MEQALMHAARGDSWEAVEVEPGTNRVLGTRTVRAGPKLVELLLAKYPKLNPYQCGVATVRGAGSSILVEDRSVVQNLALDSSRVKCASTVETASGKRAAAVVLDHGGGAVPPFPFEGKVVSVPTAALYESFLARFPCLPFPPSAWYTAAQLKATQGAWKKPSSLGGDLGALTEAVRSGFLLGAGE